MSGKREGSQDDLEIILLFSFFTIIPPMERQMNSTERIIGSMTFGAVPIPDVRLLMDIVCVEK